MWRKEKSVIVATRRIALRRNVVSLEGWKETRLVNLGLLLSVGESG